MDKQEIIATLKDEGIDIGEDMAVNAVRAAFRLLVALAPKFSTGLGHTMPIIVAYLEPLIVRALDDAFSSDKDS